MKYNQITISSDKAYMITPSEPARAVCLICASADFFLGDAGVTAVTGLLVKAGIPYPIESTGAIYGTTSTGSSVVSFLDERYPNQGPNPGSIV